MCFVVVVGVFVVLGPTGVSFLACFLLLLLLLLLRLRCWLRGRPSGAELEPSLSSSLVALSPRRPPGRLTVLRRGSESEDPEDDRALSLMSPPNAPTTWMAGAASTWCIDSSPGEEDTTREAVASEKFTPNVKSDSLEFAMTTKKITMW